MLLLFIDIPQLRVKDFGISPKQLGKNKKRITPITIGIGNSIINSKEPSIESTFVLVYSKETTEGSTGEIFFKFIEES